LRAKVALANGERVDYFCGSTGVADDDTTSPYGGAYGNGETGQAADLAEQRLVVERMLEFVEEHSGGAGARAILAGSIYSGQEHRDAEGNILTDPWLPEVYDILAAELQPLVAADYVPKCDACTDNPNDPPYVDVHATVGSWVTHLFGRGFSSDDVSETTRTFTEPTVAVERGGGTTLVPLSQLYGIRSTVRVSQ
jgi:hypothetical protein